MFEVLKKEAASVEELADAYFDIEAHRERVTSERHGTHKALLAAKINGDSKEALERVKDELANLDLELEACGEAIEILLGRIKEAIPGELTARKQELQQRIFELRAEKKGLADDILEKLGEVIGMRHGITGDLLNVVDWHWLGSQTAFPWDKQEMISRLRAHIENHNVVGGGVSINSRISELQRQVRDVQSMIEMDPEKAINAVLDQFRNCP